MSQSSVNHAPPRHNVHRGAFSIEMVVVLAVAAIAAIVVFSNSNGLFGKNEVNTAMANTQELTVNARSMLKNGGVYNFNGASDMTGLLVKFGGAPGSMKINGSKDSGTATLINVWGGSVTLDPVSSSGGKTGFSVTQDKVPQSACTVMATQMSPSFAQTAINGSATVGAVSPSEVGSQCTADSGSTGTNTLKFVSNT